MQTARLAGAPGPESRSGSLHAGWAAALEQRFALLYDPAHPEAMQTPEGVLLLAAVCDTLESGALRLVETDGAGRWRVQVWLKRVLLLLGAAGVLEPQPGPLPGMELTMLGWSDKRPAGCRIPAGSFIRRSAFLAPGCVVMPPSTVQAAACILPGVQVDSHALIGAGACLQQDVYVGCGAMIGGILLPEEALPIVLEQGVAIGGNCGLYGSMIVGQGAQILAGTVIRSVAGVYHPGQEGWLLPDSDGTLRIPPNATVQMGLPPRSAFPDGVTRLAPMLT